MCVCVAVLCVHTFLMPIHAHTTTHLCMYSVDHFSKTLFSDDLTGLLYFFFFLFYLYYCVEITDDYSTQI